MRTFSDPFFKEMLQATGDGASGTAILTDVMLKNYIVAEFAIFLVFLKVICKLKMAQSFDTPCAQAIHDGATLENKKKYQAFGVQFIDPRWLCNLVICVGFVLVLNSDDITVSAAFDSTLRERTAYSLLALCGLMVSDRAALGVARVAGVDEIEGCDMHDGDKVGSAATGKLTRSANGAVVNEFALGRGVMSRAHKMGVHFSYGKRPQVLSAIAKELSSVPDVKLKVDNNTTRVASEHGLLLSVLRMNRPLKMYKFRNPSAFVIEDGDWTAWAEFEAVLHISQVLTTLAQYETKYVAAFGPLVKMRVYKKLTASSIWVLDLDNITESPKLPRVEVQVADMSPVSRECLERAIIEFERRFLGSTSNVRLPLNPAPVVSINQRQLVATLLDVRTSKGLHLTEQQRSDAQAALKERYIECYVAKRKSQREQTYSEVVDKEDEEDKPAVKPVSAAAAKGFDLGSSDEDEVVERPTKKKKEEAKAQDEAAGAVEFKRVFRGWMTQNVDWQKEFKDEKLPAHGAVLTDEDVMDLMNCDVGPLYLKLGGMMETKKAVGPDGEAVQEVRSVFGLLPLMASCSDGQIGALNAESFAERVISGANLVMTDGNTLFDDKVLEMLVVLRMNRKFMLFMREHYFSEIKKEQPFNMTLAEEKKK